MSKILKRIQKWLHDKLGWGYVEERHAGDGFQPTYTCRFCTENRIEDHALAHDSNGDVFHLSETVKKNKKIMTKGVPLKINI